MVGDCGIANQQRDGFLKLETASLLQRTITPRFSGAIAAFLACHMRFKFWTQICLPTQFTLDKATGGAFGYLYWGISHGNRTSAA